jgi:hypothetical protein
VAVNEAGHFLDKPWMDVGVSGSAGEVVWVTYTDFNCPNPDCSPPFTNQIKAVRCNAALTNCTEPILLSGTQNSLQFSDVTIGPDGRVYVTWEEDNDLANNFEPPEHMRFWLRVAEPGSTTFGPLRRVADEPLNLGIADLHANDFRVATYPKNTVAMVEGRPRVFVVWDGCRARTLGDTVCEEPAIKLRYSDDAGVSWSRTQVLSAGGDNYFPTIDADRGSGRVAVAWYTSRFDRCSTTARTSSWSASTGRAPRWCSASGSPGSPTSRKPIRCSAAPSSATTLRWLPSTAPAMSTSTPTTSPSAYLARACPSLSRTTSSSENRSRRYEQ